MKDEVPHRVSTLLVINWAAIIDSRSHKTDNDSNDNSNDANDNYDHDDDNNDKNDNDDDDDEDDNDYDIFISVMMKMIMIMKVVIIRPKNVILEGAILLVYNPNTALLTVTYRLVGLVVKPSASRAEDPGFESRLHRDFFGVEPYY